MFCANKIGEFLSFRLMPYAYVSRIKICLKHVKRIRKE